MRVQAMSIGFNKRDAIDCYCLVSPFPSPYANAAVQD